jgi:hypothetical protein
VQQIQRLFVGKEEKGPTLPHYEEEKLKSPYLDNRFYNVAKIAWMRIGLTLCLSGVSWVLTSIVVDSITYRNATETWKLRGLYHDAWYFLNSIKRIEEVHISKNCSQHVWKYASLSACSWTRPEWLSISLTLSSIQRLSILILCLTHPSHISELLPILFNLEEQGNPWARKHVLGFCISLWELLSWKCSPRIPFGKLGVSQ